MLRALDAAIGPVFGLASGIPVLLPGGGPSGSGGPAGGLGPRLAAARCAGDGACSVACTFGGTAASLVFSSIGFGGGWKGTPSALHFFLEGSAGGAFFGVTCKTLRMK